VAVLADLGAFKVRGEEKKANLTTVPVTGQPFKQALRAEIKESSNSEWSVQMQAPTVSKVEKDDLLLATFYVRSTQPQEGGIAETQFVFEQASDPYTKSVTYPLQLTPQWRKVQVRFVAQDSYPPGKAQMIFRLGYEPETIEVGGVTVENFGKQLRLWELPSTEGADRRIAAKPPDEAPLPPTDGGPLRAEITPSKIIQTISPYVYGVNSQKIDKYRPAVRRMGGNRGTGYNWETNASNAGNDYQHSNDDWSCTVFGYKNCTEPGAQVLDFVTDNRQAGVDSLVTIPMVDYVSADKKGAVLPADAAPSKRFVRSYPHKPGPFTLKPALDDGAVYQDELVNLLVQKFGKAAQGGVKFYSLDNEPALWPTTHPRIHPKPPTYQELVDRTEATASAITAVDPTATVLGAVAYGWGEYLSLSSAADSKGFNEKYQNYINYFLASMKRLEEKHHRRLVHVLDVHWYPEVRGTKRITEENTSRKTIDARLAAPRSLWDPNYREKSFIGDQIGGPVRLIPWLRDAVDKYYPGTKLSMTEYNYGAPEHVSGGLAQVDALGIFGREGLFMADYWWGTGAGNERLPKYIAAAFALYRNYDGNGGTFGDTAVQATLPDASKASIYAATDSKHPGVLTLIVINKDQQANFKGELKLAGPTKYLAAEVYRLDGTAAEVRRLQSVTIRDNQLEYALPRLSATLFVCKSR
jgi:mannan endo-1,4-beta-mannosidase